MNISFTLSTAPLLALAAYLMYRAKGQLLPVVMFMSVFQAASIVDIGDTSVGPCYFLLLIAIAKALGFRQRRHKNNLPPFSLTLLMSLFVIYAGVSAFVGPFLFKGVPITNPKLGFNVPLQWEMVHLNQLIYLVLSFCLYLVAAYKISPAELTKSLNWFVGGTVFASLIAMYQFLGMKTGLPFPSDFIHTAKHAIFEGYEINGFPRMDSTFTEASSSASYLSIGLALSLWRMLSGSISLRIVTKSALILIGLLLSLSTTGYICLIYLCTAGAGLYLFQWKGNRDFRAAKILLAVPVLLALLVLFEVPEMRDALSKLAHTVLLDKTQSASYEQRTQMNIDAFNTAAATNWLGAGWGICRASSIVPTMLGNVGIPGFALFCAFCFKLFRPAMARGRSKLPIYGAVLFALGGALLNLAISSPQLDNPIIWLLFALAAKLAVPAPARAARSHRPRLDRAKPVLSAGPLLGDIRA